MAQLTLFEPTDVVLTDDERGRIAYTAGVIDTATAATWFAELRAAVQWRSERRQMYDREVDVPRLIGHYRLDTPPAGIPSAIVAAAARVSELVGVAFNSVGLNLYRDGRDSVAPHNDHLYDLQKGFPIALLSLGGQRSMVIRAKSAPRQTMRIDLAPGSLLVMDYDTQLHYTHGVPKTSQAVGERISLAFRVKPAPRSEDTRGTGFYK